MVMHYIKTNVDNCFLTKETKRKYSLVLGSMNKNLQSHSNQLISMNFFMSIQICSKFNRIQVLKHALPLRTFLQ